MSELTRMLTSTPDRRNLVTAQDRIVLAMRLVVVLSKLKREPVEPLTDKLGSEAAARRFLRVMEIIGDVWPEPVVVLPPCCPQTTYDEMMLLDLIIAAAKRDRGAFDSFLKDMLKDFDRERLYVAIGNFIRIYQPKSVTG